MLLVGRQTTHTCQTLDRRAFLQVGASSVLGLSLADLLRAGEKSGRNPGSREVRHPAVALGRAEPARHLRPQAERPARIPRPVRHHPHADPRRPLLRTVPATRRAHRQARRHPLADDAVERPRRRRHHRPDRQRARAAPGSTASRCKARRGRRSAASWRRCKRAVAGNAAAPVLRGRRQAAPGQEGDHRRGRRPARRRVRPVPPRIRPGDRHEGPRPAAARGPHAGTPRRPADAARRARQAGTPRRRTARRPAPGRLPRRRRSRCSRRRPRRRCSTCRRSRRGVADRYGRTRFGQSCLLARRLVERGVPFVQVNWSDHVEAEEDAGDGGWDHHYRNFQIMQDRHAPWLDQAMSALLDDLHDRGLLASTLVLAVGEFGRSPKINDKAGRDHWPHCYSALVGRRRREPAAGSSAPATRRPHSPRTRR